MKKLPKYYLTLAFTCVIAIISISCSKDEEFNSEYFFGKWSQEFEHWHLIQGGVDTLLFRDTFLIEFYDDGTCVQNTSQGELVFDWFYREIPRQIYLTKVDQPWPGDNLYDIVEFGDNFQVWEQKVELSSIKTNLYLFKLSRIE